MNRAEIPPSRPCAAVAGPRWKGIAVRMRGPKKQAVVVRKPDGQLETQVKDLRFIKDRYPVLGLPFLRGVVNFADSMYDGVTALMYSAEFFPRGRGERGGRGGVQAGAVAGTAPGQRKGYLGHHHPGGAAGGGDVHRPVFPAAHPAGGVHRRAVHRLHAGPEPGREPAEDHHFRGLPGPVLPDVYSFQGAEGFEPFHDFHRTDVTRMPYLVAWFKVFQVTLVPVAVRVR